MTVRISGTEIRLGFSFFAVITLMLLLCKSQTVLLCIASSLLHECGHISAMCICGEKPREIVFGAFGIRIERDAQSMLSYKKEAIISAGGVAVNLLLAIVFCAWYGINGSYFAFSGIYVNLFIGALNCIPVSVLDSGRFLRYILFMRFEEEKVLRTLLVVSDISVLVFAVFTVFYTVFFGLNISLVSVCVYLIAINLKTTDMEI